MSTPRPSQPRCRARSKQRGEQCRNTAVPGMAVCRYHGGATPVGPDSPHFKTGRYSRHAPTRLAARIDAALQDPALMSLKDEAALLSAQIAEVLEVLDLGGLAARWRELTALVTALRAAIEAESEKQLVAVADAMDACLLQAADERGRWGELLALVDQKRKLVETQAKVDQRDTLSVTEQALLVGAFVAALRLVRDDEDRRAAMAHITRTLELPARTEAPSA